MSDIVVPAMGESIVEGTISSWAVNVGDAVQQGDLLLELETDKVNLEISAEQAGVVAEIIRQAGETVQVGEVIGKIRAGTAGAGRAAEGQTAVPEASSRNEAMAGASQAVSQAANSATATTADQAAKSAASSSEVKTAASEAASPAAGEAANPASGTANILPPAAPSAASDQAGERSAAAPASPAARKLAREQGIDLRRVDVRDPLGRIYPADIRAQGTQHSANSAPAPAVPAAADARWSGKPEQRQRMSRRRATIAKRLVAAQQEAAMLTTFNEVDMTAILDVRKRRKQSFLEKHEVGLGFMSFFTKAVVGALKAFPLLNAEIDGDEMVIKQYYDIGIAVSAKEGLVVPVVRDADRLSFAEIERNIAELAAKARSNKLELSDLQGGTFTITNGGVFGSLLSTPILNAPQVGILGMHKIQLRPIAIDQEKMANRPMMYVALSYDHRIVDGADAVQFLVRVKELLEDPETLLLEG